MKTFQEFRLILERYYEPDEKLPSGATPLKKAKAKGITGPLLAKVKRGADNPNWDTSRHPDFRIVKDKMHDVIKYHHLPSGTKWYVTPNSNLTTSGRHTDKSVHEVEWDAPKSENESLRSRVGKIHTAMRLWRDEIAPRAPHGSIIHSRTLRNEKDKNKSTRSKVYEKEGMGKFEKGSQWGLVGRNPSPKQKGKGKRRLTPIRLRSRNLFEPPIKKY